MGLPPVGRIRSIKKDLTEQRVDLQSRANAEAKASDGKKAYPFGTPSYREVKAAPSPSPVQETVKVPPKKATLQFSNKNTVAELKALARDSGIKVPSKINKGALLNLLGQYIG